MPLSAGDVSMPEFHDVDGNLVHSSSKNRQQHSAAGYRKSVRPAVHSMPVKDGSHWLNAYYFVTSESDTWQKLALKFYNRAEHVELLKTWNRTTKLEVGSVIYYNSPFRPQDREKILSFAEDFGQPLKQQRVMAGDSLSKIAGALWGNVHAWPAIAAINPQIAHPDLIQVGETLFIPPNVDSANILANLVNPQMDDSLPEMNSLDANSQVQDDLGAGAAVTGTIESPTPPADSNRSPLRTSTIIILAGIIAALASLIYFLWKRNQAQDPYAGSLSKMDRLTSFFKTKSGV